LSVFRRSDSNLLSVRSQRFFKKNRQGGWSCFL